MADILDVSGGRSSGIPRVWVWPWHRSCVADGFGPLLHRRPGSPPLPALQPPGVYRGLMLGRLFRIPRRRCGRDTPQAAQ